MIIARHATPPLTTIRIPRVEMGRSAARTLFDLVDNPAHARRKILYTPQVDVRSSCAPPLIESRWRCRGCGSRQVSPAARRASMSSG
jgi:hypothetical protein